MTQERKQHLITKKAEFEAMLTRAEARNDNRAALAYAGIIASFEHIIETGVE